MVGAKMEEQEPNIPLITQLIKVAKINCTVQQMSEAELMVLKAHAWNGKPRVFVHREGTRVPTHPSCRGTGCLGHKSVNLRASVCCTASRYQANRVRAVVRAVHRLP